MTCQTTARLNSLCASQHKTLEELRAPNKSRPMVRLRHRCAFELIIIEGFSLSGAGALLRLHHTTALHGLRVFAQHHFGTPYRASLEDIRAAWMASQMEAAA